MTTRPVVQPVSVAQPLLLALHAAQPARYPALFESAAAGEPFGRFDILFAFPGERLTLQSDWQTVGRGFDSRAMPFLSCLDEWYRQEQTALAESPLPFHGGWLVYLGYELAGQIEPRLRLSPPTAGPIAQALRIPAAIIHEHGSDRSWIVAEQGHEATIAAISDDLAKLVASPEGSPSLLKGVVEEDAPELYLQAIEQALEYIRAGDIYQANLSREWRAQLARGIQPFHLYERLRQTNPGPFCGVARLDDIAIVSSSPERLIAVRDGWISTRPIAGTRPRGADPASDELLVRELRAHPKERAEHIMLLDLERNDLGRVCESGTVEVDEYMTIESYAHVHHIVSNVKGRLRSDVSPGQALAAVFPGGTITGCPKVRCMEIVAELERAPRGAYTGSLGYLNRDGSMDFNILIRSLEVRGDRVTLRAGAGIVADSIPQRELEESRAKARGVLRALTGEGT